MFLFAAASLILATGCEEPEPEKTAEPQIFDFQVPEEEIEAFSARIIITCSDESLLWIGDITAELTEEEIYKKTLAEADMEYKGDPAPLYIMSYDECSTICVIAVDAEGNFETCTWRSPPSPRKAHATITHSSINTSMLSGAHQLLPLLSDPG